MVLSNNCGYVGVGRLSSRPWIIKFDQEGREVWSKIFEEIPIPQGNYSDGYQFASAIDNTNDGGYIFVQQLVLIIPVIIQQVIL